MKKTRKIILLSLAFTVLIFLVHGIFSYFVNDITIIRTLRPIRDILFFPFIAIVDSTFELYCGAAKIGLLDYGRCITPTGPGLNMPDGPPAWFELTIRILGLIVISIYYIFIFKVIQAIMDRFHSSPNSV